MRKEFGVQESGGGGRFGVRKRGLRLESGVYVVFSCQVRVAQKQLSLTFSVDPAVPEGLYGDPNRIQQCLLNLGTFYTSNPES